MLLLLLGFLVDGGEGLFRLGLGLTGLLLVGLATAGATRLGAGSIAWVGGFGVHGGNWRIAVDGSDFERYWGTEEIAEVMLMDEDGLLGVVTSQSSSRTSFPKASTSQLG